MLNKKNSFKDFMKRNGFYILTGVSLIAIVVVAMIVPKKGEQNVADQTEKHAPDHAAVKDISDLRVPTIDSRMDQEELIEEDTIEVSQGDTAQIDMDQTSEAEIGEADEETQEEELTSETFSSTTSTETELFHADNDLFEWPLENKIIYPYSDNDQGRSFMNPTLERTMRSFGLFIEAEEDSKVTVAAPGKVISILDYPMAELSAEMDYPQVGKAVIVDHGNNWKTVYGLHGGQESVEEGDTVQMGDIVGLVGKPSKDFSLTGPNLYFQILKNDVPVDPEKKLDSLKDM